MGQAISAERIQEVRATLVAQHGVIIFPKRDFEIPSIDKGKLKEVLGRGGGDCNGILNGMVEYLKCDAVGDKFGIDEEARRAWRKEAEEKLGSAFWEVMVDRNQLVQARMSAVVSGPYTLAMLARRNHHPEIADQLILPAGKMLHRVSGPQLYNKLERLEDKLKVVHFVEDKSLEVLRMFS